MACDEFKRPTSQDDQVEDIWACANNWNRGICLNAIHRLHIPARLILCSFGKLEHLQYPLAMDCGVDIELKFVSTQPIGREDVRGLHRTGTAMSDSETRCNSQILDTYIGPVTCDL